MKDKILELIPKYLYTYPPSPSADDEEAEWIEGVDKEQFKKEMLKLSLPWRDFDKEKPIDDSQIIVVKLWTVRDYQYYDNLNYSGKWIYKSELFDTLPKEK